MSNVLAKPYSYRVAEEEKMEKKMMNAAEKEKEANTMMYGAGKKSDVMDLIYGTCCLGAVCVGGLFGTTAAFFTMINVTRLRRDINAIQHSEKFYFAWTKLSGPWYNRYFQYRGGLKPKPAPSTNSD